VGQLRLTRGTTNASGEFSTTYTPSHIGGIVNIRAALGGGGSTEFGEQIRVVGLQELGAGTNYRLIGFENTPEHPLGTNHWGTAAANTGLVQIADDYKNTFYGQGAIPENDMLRYNDQSLPFGGKFDLDHRWGAAGEHAEHRMGINCDVRCCGSPGDVPQNRRAQLNAIFTLRGSTGTLDETATAKPHWHLRFLFGAPQAAVLRTSGAFLNEAFSAALEREAAEDEWQERMDMFDGAHAQGQTQTLDVAKASTSALFYSMEYSGRSRSDQEFVTDLYAAFLLRAPDEGGYNFWLAVLQNDNNNGQPGRAHLIQAFVECSEFADLIYAFTDTPPPPPVCDPQQESSCYNNGGTWDPDFCDCTYEPDPCIRKPWLCDEY
jgi:Domain of unknown function (DUF4214)